MRHPLTLEHGTLLKISTGRISLIFDENNELQSLGGDFVPGISRDQAILGQPGTDDTPESLEQPSAPATQPTQPTQPTMDDSAPAAGSLQEQIQREVDAMETAPIPTSRLEDDED